MRIEFSFLYNAAPYKFIFDDLPVEYADQDILELKKRISIKIVNQLCLDKEQIQNEQLHITT